MSLSDIRYEVESLLAEAEARIAKAEAKHKAGPPHERVEAAGELAILKHQKEVLDRRLRDIAGAESGQGALFQWLKEDLFNLTFHLDKVITRL